MKIILYQCLCENIRLDKTNYLTKLFEFEGTLREECSLTSPVIRVQLIELAKIVKANYAYIEDFGRYYYIDDIVGERTGIVSLYMSTDVLMSFKEGILNLDVVCSRNEYNFDYKVIDDKLPAKLEWNIRKDTFSKFSYFYPQNGITSGQLFYKIQYSSDTIFDADVSGGVLTTNNCIIYCNKTGLMCFLQGVTKSTGWSLNNLFKDNPTQGIISVSMIPIKMPAPGMKLIPTNSSGKYEFNVIGNNVTVESSFSGYGESKFYAWNRENTPSLPNYPNNNFDSVFKEDIILDLTTIEKDDIDFVNYYPFTKSSLVLPYLGSVDLDINYLFQFDKVVASYYFDSSVCELSIVVKLTKNNVETIIRTFNVDLTVNIPITQTNYNDINRNKVFGLLNMGNQMISTIAGGNIGRVSGSLSSSSRLTRINYSRNMKNNPTSVREEKSNFNKQIKGYDHLMNSAGSSLLDLAAGMVEHVSSGTVGGSYLNFALFSEACLIRITPKVFDYGYTLSYSKLLGRPSTYNGLLSGLHGYTEIAGVHIEFNDLDFSPTLEECDNIEYLLKTGVILSEPT